KKFLQLNMRNNKSINGIGESITALIYFHSFLHLEISIDSPLSTEGITQDPNVLSVSFIVSDYNHWLIANDLLTLRLVDTSFVEEETAIHWNFNNCGMAEGKNDTDEVICGHSVLGLPCVMIIRECTSETRESIC
ncbi:hypothetical protein PENTCL1PPCAC_27033, partial [Pristionchus entomophagus]